MTSDAASIYKETHSSRLRHSYISIIHTPQEVRTGSAYHKVAPCHIITTPVYSHHERNMQSSLYPECSLLSTCRQQTFHWKQTIAAWLCAQPEVTISTVNSELQLINLGLVYVILLPFLSCSSSYEPQLWLAQLGGATSPSGQAWPVVDWSTTGQAWPIGMYSRWLFA